MKERTAYSLLELSIVIVIISVLISGGLSVATVGVNNAKIKLTKERIQKIYEAIGNHVANNGRYPCPANIKLLKSSDTNNYGVAVGSAGSCIGAGVYQSSSSTNLIYGMVPVIDLKLPKDMAEDGFGNKIGYVVSKHYTKAANFNNPPNFSDTNFSINYTKEDPNINIKVKEMPSTSEQKGVTILLISHGANKYGAYGANSASQNGPSSDNDEASNYLTGQNDGVSPPTSTFDNSFISISTNSDVFDDILLFRNIYLLFDEFNAFRLVPCNGNNDTAAWYYTQFSSVAGTVNNNAWYGQVVNGNACSGTDFDKNYAKKCSASGQWIQTVNCGLLQ